MGQRGSRLAARPQYHNHRYSTFYPGQQRFREIRLRRRLQRLQRPPRTETRFFPFRHPDARIYRSREKHNAIDLPLFWIICQLVRRLRTEQVSLSLVASERTS